MDAFRQIFQSGQAFFGIASQGSQGRRPGAAFFLCREWRR